MVLRRSCAFLSTALGQRDIAGRARRAIPVIVIVVLGLAIGSGTVGAGPTIRLSQSTAGVQPNGASYAPSVSATGRFVAFASDATNLAPGSTNNVTQIYVRDRDTDADIPYDFDDASTSDSDNDPASVATSLTSADADGSAGTAPSSSPAISADGRFVAFASYATNLITAGTDGYSQIFVRDRQLNTTVVVSADVNGNAGTADSLSPAISSDGRFVAFASYATNLLTGVGNGYAQIFVRDRQTNTTTLISVSSTGAPGDADSVSPSISWTGRWVVFASTATTLVSGTANGYSQVFVRDRDVDHDNDYDDQAASDTSNPSDRNGTNVTTTRVSVDNSSPPNQATADSIAPMVSPDGSAVVFSSTATNLVTSPALNGRAQVFEHKGSTTNLVSVDSTGIQGDGDSTNPAPSYDGRFVAFQSLATNLAGAGNDTNGAWDAFVHDLTGAPYTPPNPPYGTYRVSVDGSGIQANADSITPSISADGRFVAFASSATNLAPGDTNGVDDIFVQDTDTEHDGYGDVLETALKPTLTSTWPTTYCGIMRADVNGDGSVNALDLNLLGKEFLHTTPPANPRLDQNSDGMIDNLDQNRLGHYFLQSVSSCPP